MSSNGLRPILVATVLSAVMMTGALAQSTTTTGQMPNRDTRTTTEASDAKNPNAPGATGTTVVPGNNSTVTGDSSATRRQQTGPSTSSH